MFNELVFTFDTYLPFMAHIIHVSLVIGNYIYIILYNKFPYDCIGVIQTSVFYNLLKYVRTISVYSKSQPIGYYIRILTCVSISFLIGCNCFTSPTFDFSVSVFFTKSWGLHKLLSSIRLNSLVHI